MLDSHGRTAFAKHFDGKRFFSPDAPEPRGWRDVLRWQLTSRREQSPRFVSDVEPTTPPAVVPGKTLRITMVNHSTVLLQHNGINILTDPIWSERTSPLSWAGPRRRRAPGVRRADLPRIDVVLLSHNHYDHLDTATLRWLAASDTTSFVVPTGVARFLRSLGIAKVSELDWGDSVAVGDSSVHAVPATHFSGRSLFDRNRTLWCGYVVTSPYGNIYYAGDTAFGSHFAHIRELFGAPRLALLPIGAYEPRWFMSPVHMGPDQAIEAHRILEAQASVATHHGTFQLADDGIDTARRELLAQSPPGAFRVLGNGQSVELA
jgi:L-ascorbate metabolism protein UlaG (beta-lactamase superfamily)